MARARLHGALERARHDGETGAALILAGLCLELSAAWAPCPACTRDLEAHAAGCAL